MNERIMKMDRNNKSILIRALHADYRARKQAGREYHAVGDLILRVNDTAPGKLLLDDAEYRMARNALNQLRSERIAAGGCTDAADDALCKLARAKAPGLLFRCWTIDIK